MLQLAYIYKKEEKMETRKQMLKRGNRRLLSLIMALALILTSLSLAPSTKTEAAETVKASGYCGVGSNLKDVRWEVKGSTLYITGQGAFSGLVQGTDFMASGDCNLKWINYVDDITSVVIGEGITDIGYASFFCMDALTSVKLPASLKNIEALAFAMCDGISKVTIASGSKLEYIGYYAVYSYPEIKETWYEALSKCDNLSAVEGEILYKCPDKYLTHDPADEKITYFNKILVDGKTTKESVKVKEGTLGIAPDAFYGNTYIKSVTFPKSLKALGSEAFYKAYNLGNITATGVHFEYVADGVFDETEWMSKQSTKPYYQINNVLLKGSESVANDTVLIKKDIDLLAMGAYAENNVIKNITFDSTSKITKIPVNSFERSSLESIKLPGSLTEINDMAFTFCQLKSVYIPASVKYISADAFNDCPNLKTVTGGAGLEDCKKSAFDGTPYADVSADKTKIVKLGKCLITAKYYNPSDAVVTLPTDCICVSGNIEIDGASDLIIPENYKNCYSEEIKFFDLGGSDTMPSVTFSCGLTTFPAIYLYNTASFDTVEVKCVKDSAADAFYTAFKDANSTKYKVDTSINHVKASAVKKNEVKPTCTKAGSYDSVVSCKHCGVQMSSKHVTVDALGHKEGKASVSSKASASRDGKLVTKCTRCSKVLKTAVIPQAYITLDHTVAYTGKAVKPNLKITDKKGKAISSSYYTVAYANNKKTGKASVTVKFKTRYTGTVKKTFVITKKDYIPAAVSVKSVTAKSKAFVVTWKPVSKNCTGYEIQYSTDKNFLSADTTINKVDKAARKTLTVKNLKPKKVYYVRIRSTNKDKNKNVVHSAWSKAKKITTK